LVPLLPRFGYAADVDVVIIGAGSAGLSASKVFMEKGVSFKLLEAKNRIGGRALTDSAAFGKPFDLGCALQHQAANNPFVDYARKNRFKIGPLPADKFSKVWIGRREASGGQYTAMDRQYKKFEKALISAGQFNKDISVAEAISGIKAGKYDQMVMNWMLAGTDPKKVSLMDWYSGKDGEDYFCPAGYGTLVQHFGSDVPVELETEVTEIDWSGPGVKVTCSQGTIHAKHCVITVSNGVLASGKITFTPAINERQDIVSGIPMARYITVGLKFRRRNMLPTKRNAWFHTLNKGKVLGWIDDIGASGVVRANIHGNVAENLEQQGERAVIQFALDEMRSALGSKSVPKPRKTKTYLWGRDPHVLGTWSVARPGFGSKRYLLRRSIGERLHFAGEACHYNMYTTCHGAMLSGSQTARQLANLLK
jgi:monoamine oxidase